MDGRSFRHAPVANSSAGSGLVLVEAHAFRRGRAVEPDRYVHQAEAEVTDPHRLRHSKYLPLTRPPKPRAGAHEITRMEHALLTMPARAPRPSSL